MCNMIVYTFTVVILLSGVVYGDQEGLNSSTHNMEVDSDSYIGNIMSSTNFYVTGSSLETSYIYHMDKQYTRTFKYFIVCRNPSESFLISVSAPDPNMLQIGGESQFPVICGYNETMSQGEVTVSVNSGIIGTTSLDFKLTRSEISNSSDAFVNISSYTIDNNRPRNITTMDTFSFPVLVVRTIRPVDRLFRIVIYCVQVFVGMGFGTKLDLEVVKKHLRKPVAVSIGLVCQYLLMPLIAYTVAMIVPMDNTVVALGIFIAGCCPGGGGSNMYSYLLNGDLSLSITMTALSTAAALAMMPLWIYTLGSLFLVDGNNVQIPFQTVAIALSILIIPLIFGVFLRQKFPKIATKVQKALKPVILIMSILLIFVGIYSNLYIFRMFKPRIVLAACLLPYVGYILGGLVATGFRQPWPRIKTIAIETGMQNTNIAYILLMASFPEPLGDIAAIAPVASAVMTPLPIFSVTIVYLIHQKCKKQDKEPGVEEIEQDMKNLNGKNEASEPLTRQEKEEKLVADV